ncbi:MAG: hypothetical protein WBW69_12690 [Candidatus Korobacteraceae bacterium]
MRTRLIALSCCIALTAMLAYAQTGDFQPATVVSIDKMASDAQHPEYGDHYRIGMRIGDTIYTCRGSGGPAQYMGWAPNKEFPAQVDLKAKTITVKGPADQPVVLTITGKKIAK